MSQHRAAVWAEKALHSLEGQHRGRDRRGVGVPGWPARSGRPTNKRVVSSAAGCRMRNGQLPALFTPVFSDCEP